MCVVLSGLSCDVWRVVLSVLSRDVSCSFYHVMCVLFCLFCQLMCVVLLVMSRDVCCVVRSVTCCVVRSVM